MHFALKIRSVIGLLVLLAIGYTALWYTVGFRTQKNLAATFSEWRDSGLRVEHDSISLSGFPYRIILNVSDISLSTRQRGLAVSAKTLELVSHLWTPDHWVIGATDADVGVADDAYRFQEAFLQASYRIHDGNKTVIKIDSAGADDFSWTSDTSLPKPAAWTLLLGKDDSELSSSSGLYEQRSLEFKLYAETADGTIDLTGGLSGPTPRDWSASELRNWRDGGGLLAIDTMTWSLSGTQATINGDLTLDETLRPLGSLSFTLENWDAFARAVTHVGLAPPNDGPDSAAIMIQNGLMQVGDATIGRVTPVLN